MTAVKKTVRKGKTFFLVILFSFMAGVPYYQYAEKFQNQMSDIRCAELAALFFLTLFASDTF